MATGSGTGTPVTGASAATLSTLRARIRTMVEAASGRTEPLAMTRSDETLTTLRDRVETLLQDSGNARWASGDVDEAIEQALEEYSQLNPDHAIGTVTLSAAGREIDISALTGLVRVEKVWWGYDSATPGYPPAYRQFEFLPGSLLYIDDASQPASGDTVRVYYTKAHTLSGLNSATATTIELDDVQGMIAKAAGICAKMRTMELAETLNVDKEVTKRLSEWGEDQLKQAARVWRRRLQAWERRAYGYDQDDIDEALRWALHRLSEVSPDRTITTLTLSASGREVDVSSITDYLEFERVWWPYDSSDPAYPPNWRDFVLWPSDDILFIKDGDEPQSADVVRVWYTRIHSLNGLDSASVTTIKADQETLITGGAAGFVAQERVQDQPGSRVPVRLREWADARLREFERGLAALSQREGARASGVAQGPSLDRWDADGSEWW